MKKILRSILIQNFWYQALILTDYDLKDIEYENLIKSYPIWLGLESIYSNWKTLVLSAA